MSFFEKYAYHKKETLVLVDTSGKENSLRNEDESDEAFTRSGLNSTHQPADRQAQRRQQRLRRRAYILSSSSEEGEPPPPHRRSTNDVFEGFPLSKRRKQSASSDIGQNGTGKLYVSNEHEHTPNHVQNHVQNRGKVGGVACGTAESALLNKGKGRGRGRDKRAVMLEVSSDSENEELGSCDGTISGRAMGRDHRCTGGTRRKVRGANKWPVASSSRTDHTLMERGTLGGSCWLSKRSRPVTMGKSKQQLSFCKPLDVGGPGRAWSYVPRSSSSSSSSSRQRRTIHGQGGVKGVSTDASTSVQESYTDDETISGSESESADSSVLAADSSVVVVDSQSEDADSSSLLREQDGACQDVPKQLPEDAGGNESSGSSCCIVIADSPAPVVADVAFPPADSAATRFYGMPKPRPSHPSAHSHASIPAVRRSSRGDRAQVLEKLGDDMEDENCSDSGEEDYTLREQTAVLEFMNGCGEEDLCDIPGCSLTKAKALEELRPFKDWSMLNDVLTSTRALSEKFIDGCLRVLEERKLMKKLMSKCLAISTTIQDYLAKLQHPSMGAKDGVQCSKQPSILSESVQLKPYQLVGLNWVSLLHSQNLNGILADEMGLGKTVQAIAFLAHLYESGFHGLFLIIVPTSTVENWARELEKWCPTLRVLVYHAPMAERALLRAEVMSGAEYNVILSTYRVAIGKGLDMNFFCKLSFQCLVLDEAHMVKNMSSLRYSYLMRIKAKRRMLLTGTPFQNNLLELVSLLSFVMPDVFSDFSAQLKNTFSRKIGKNSSYYREHVKQAKQIMQPFILRRLKSQVLRELPAKVETTVQCTMTGTQLHLYSAAVDRLKKEWQDRPINTAAAVPIDHSGSMSVIMELRRLAMHPLLVRHWYRDDTLREMVEEIRKHPEGADADPAFLYEDLALMTDFELHNYCMEKKFLVKHLLPIECLERSAKFEYLKVKLQELKDQGSRVLMFSQFTMMLDVMEPFFKLCGHTYLRLDGTTRTAERQPLIDKYNSDNTIFIFLLSTKAGGLGINLTSANVVILHDIDLNPYNDRQAQDRCHRVGQTREVSVLRLITQDTIEEGILQCAENKLKLEQDLNHINADGPSSADVALLLQHGLGQDGCVNAIKSHDM